VYTYAPGETIQVSIFEFIGHPSYFRIAFDNDGDDGFVEPASIKPIDPARKCPSAPGDRCGAADFYNSPAVLPGMDNLNPHLGGLGSKATYTWSVTLPNVECTNCTLQIIQVMEDDLYHGPYDPTPGVGVEDVYHQCIDLELKRGTPDGGIAPVVSDAGATPTPTVNSGTATADASDSGEGGGCAVTGTATRGALGWSVVAAGLLVASRRRRARR
jgi:hypothetical protein